MLWARVLTPSALCWCKHVRQNLHLTSLLIVFVVAMSQGGALAHHVGDEMGKEKFTKFVLKTALQSCYALVDDTPRLREHAEYNHWDAASDEMLRKSNHPSYKLINGWTFDAHDRSFAVQQTENAADRSRSCSISTTLKSEAEYNEIRDSWDRSMEIERHEDRITQSRIFHMDAITRPLATKLVTTLSFDRQAGTFNVLVTLPPRNASGKAPSAPNVRRRAGS
jgi:hypothetical protein